MRPDSTCPAIAENPDPRISATSGAHPESRPKASFDTAEAPIASGLAGDVNAVRHNRERLDARSGVHRHTTAHLRAGNKSAAGQYALRLQTVDRELEENRRQLAQAEETYKNLVKARDVAVAAARAKIESLKGAITDMRMNQALAEMHETAAGMVSEIGGSGDTLNRLHEMVEDERTRAAGRARVAKDAIDMSEVDVKASEMEALADQALADFAAKEGIVLEGAAPAAPAPRAMGAPTAAPRASEDEGGPKGG